MDWKTMKIQLDDNQELEIRAETWLKERGIPAKPFVFSFSDTYEFFYLRVDASDVEKIRDGLTKWLEE